jgi:hypothetical protein
MRKTLGLLLGAVLALGVAGTAGAKSLDWHGTIEVELGALETGVLVGSGVATVNDSSGSAHLSTLRLGPGITGSTAVVVTDPNSTGQIKSIRITGEPLTPPMTITGVSGAPPLGAANQLAMPGFTRVCVFVPCAPGSVNLPLQHTTNQTNGIGIGGLVTLGGNGTIRISIEAAPWTLGTGTAENQTVKGNFITVTRTGFVHGGASASNSSTANDSGVIQLISPEQITTAGIVGNSTKMNLFLTMTLHFIPEPGLLLLLGSGVVGLGLLGRSRMKK